MKRYAIIIKDPKKVKVLNDKIATDSLFSHGETITCKPLLVGENYTDDVRIYNSAMDISDTWYPELLGYVKAIDLSAFEYLGAKVEITDDSITVDGYKMPLRFKSGYICKVNKTFIGTNDNSRFGTFLLDSNWIHEAKGIFEHIRHYGKKVI